MTTIEFSAVRASVAQAVKQAEQARALRIENIDRQLPALESDLATKQQEVAALRAEREWLQAQTRALPAMPAALPETYAWLRRAMPNGTLAGLDGTAGKPEGVVIRSPSRDFIAKVRLEDYERTLGRSPAPTAAGGE